MIAVLTVEKEKFSLWLREKFLSLIVYELQERNQDSFQPLKVFMFSCFRFLIYAFLPFSPFPYQSWYFSFLLHNHELTFVHKTHTTKLLSLFSPSFSIKIIATKVMNLVWMFEWTFLCFWLGHFRVKTTNVCDGGEM